VAEERAAKREFNRLKLTTTTGELEVAGAAEESARKPKRLDRLNLTTTTGELDAAGVAEERAAKRELDGS
jgi:hypothetical protein